MKQLIALLFLTQVASAQDYLNDLSHPSANPLKQEGQLVSVRIAIGEPIKIYVVGKEEARLDLSRLKLVVRRLTPYPGKSLQIVQHENYFTVSETLKDDPMDLEIKAKINNKQETFRFKIKNKLP